MTIFEFSMVIMATCSIFQTLIAYDTWCHNGK